jgi:hypothetical protein
VDDTDFTQMVMAGIATHEMFVSFVRGGFTEDQALKLVANIISNHKNNEEKEN